MDTTVFADWFKLFCGFIKDHPLLLLYNGLLSHISLDVAELTLRENLSFLNSLRMSLMCYNLLMFHVSGLSRENGRRC